jgi:hypothetical protein
MAVAAPDQEILAKLRAGCPPDSLPTVLDDFSLTVDREPLTEGGEVPGSTAVWVGRFRKIADVKLGLWGMPTLVDDAQLLISELVTNAFRYGRRPQITFRMVLGLRTLVLEVDDGSPERPQLRDTCLDAVTGRGLFLVATLAASWGVSEDGTRTWCVLKAPAAGRAGTSGRRPPRPDG